MIRKVDLVNAVVSTLAGQRILTGPCVTCPVGGHVDAVGLSAQFSGPMKTTLNAAETILYVADSGTPGYIRALDLATLAVTTLAGGATFATVPAPALSGPGLSMNMNQAWGVAVDSSGGNLFAITNYPYRVAQLSLLDGTVTTISGGYGPAGGGGPTAISFNPNVYATADGIGTNGFFAQCMDIVRDPSSE